MAELLNVRNLCKNSILNKINFSLMEGEMVAVMGPSGSGKSTLLYNVSGMDQADSGEVWLKNIEIVGLSEDDKARLRLHQMGFVFQQMNMMANLTILDNILLPAYQANKNSHKRNKSTYSKEEIKTYTKEEIKEYAKEQMKRLSISDLAERSITQVSGGQLQRACICRSIINQPKILFADEPTGALNQSAAAEVMQTLLQLNQDGTSVLIVTHDSKVASKCDRIIYLLDGRIEGELLLGKMESENKGGLLTEKNSQNKRNSSTAAEKNEKERETKVNDWLTAMGW